MKHVVDKGKSQTQKDKVGENLYNRGVYNSVLVAEAIRNAQKHHRQEGGDRRGRAARLRDAEDHRRRAGRSSACENFAAPIEACPAPTTTATTRPTCSNGTAPSG